MEHQIRITNRGGDTNDFGIQEETATKSDFLKECLNLQQLIFCQQILSLYQLVYSLLFI